MSQEKISVYNLADLKNTSDDAIPNYLNSLKFTQSNYLTDVRLGLGFSAFAIAGACFLWDWKIGFYETKYYSTAAVLIYVALNIALTYWAYYVEGDVIYVGTTPDGTQKVTIATSIEKYTPIYNVTVTATPVKGGGSATTSKFSKHFSAWFDSAGHFIAAPFQSTLASSVPAIGKADPKRAVASTGAVAGVDSSSEYTPEVLEALAAATATTTRTGPNKKGGKRRKV